MSTKYQLYCTTCNMPVALEIVDYEGYRASCAHTRYTLNVGSGERPRTWLQRKKLKSPDGFKITGPTDWTDDGPVGREAVCTKCGTGDHVEVTFESVDMAGDFDMKATLECMADHKGVRTREHKAVAYAYTAHEHGDFWPEQQGDTSDS